MIYLLNKTCCTSVNINLLNYIMVFSAPAPGVGSSKRLALCMQDDVNNWDNVPVSDTSIRKIYGADSYIAHGSIHAFINQHALRPLHHDLSQQHGQPKGDGISIYPGSK
jgi:hypothetical protein